jgi:hypothetical protein
MANFVFVKEIIIILYYITVRPRLINYQATLPAVILANKPYSYLNTDRYMMVGDTGIKININF